MLQVVALAPILKQRKRIFSLIPLVGQLVQLEGQILDLVEVRSQLLVFMLELETQARECLGVLVFLGLLFVED